MTIRNFNNNRKASLGFAEAVELYIAPLLATKGFSRTEQTTRSVKFQSAIVTLEVFHDPRSYEIDLVYSLTAAPRERYDLNDLLEAEIGTGHNEQAFFQASEQACVVATIKRIAEYLKKYGEQVLSGDPMTYRRIGMAAQRHNEAYTKQVVQQPVRKEAEESWQKHDYVRVRDLYTSIEAGLTPVERKRLNYARSRSLHQVDEHDRVQVLAKTTNDILDAIIHLPRRFCNSPNKPIRTLLAETGYTDVREKVSIHAIRKALSEHPECIADWLQYSADKRTRSGWFINSALSGTFVVGYLVDDHRKDNTQEIYDDEIEACAVFIKREIESIL